MIGDYTHLSLDRVDEVKYDGDGKLLSTQFDNVGTL